MSWVFLPPALVFLVLSKFPVDQVTGQPLSSHICCILLDGGFLLPTVLKMLQDIPCHLSTMNGLIKDVSVDQVLKGLPSFNPLATQRCVIQKGVFISWFVRQWQGEL